MGLVSNIKKRVKEHGKNAKEIIFFQDGKKRRIRFLQELDDGFEFTFHSQFNAGINCFCLSQIEQNCPYCDVGTEFDDDDNKLSEEVRYVWSVWDYDANEVKIMIWKVSRATPVQSFIDNDDEYGNITDRDYIIKRNGTKQDTSYTVTAGERSTFRNKKAKPFSKKQVIEVLTKAFPPNSEDIEDEDYEDEDEAQKRSSKKASSKKTPVKKGTATKAKKKEKTIHEKLEELDFDELKEIGYALSISKKDMKGMDEEDLLELMFDDYEEEDIEEAYEDYLIDNDADDEDEDDDE